MLVLLGCGTALMSDGDYVATALAFGFALLVAFCVFGRISGAHVNPAVSVGVALAGRMPWRRVPGYVAAQLGGAILAGAALFTLLHGFDGFDADGTMAQNFFGDEGVGYAWWAALLLELPMTAILVWVYLAVTDPRHDAAALAPVAIGLSLTAVHLASISATGTSVNPARSIGPALFAGTDAVLQLWLFILAPLLGGLAAGATYPLVFGRGDRVPGAGLRPRRPVREAIQAPDAVAVAHEPQAQHGWGPEPIIQDGWQWDPHAQQWIPATGPAAQSWPEEDDGRTRIRPGQAP